MAFLGPIVVVAERPAAEAVDLLGQAGAFPVIESRWADAAAAIGEIEPCAVVLADPKPTGDPDPAAALAQRIEAMGLVTPVLALLDNDSAIPVASALAVGCEERLERMIARLRSALRIRSLHAAVVRRAGATAPLALAARPTAPDLLGHATVLCIGRGRSYPALAVAIGERMGLIGAMSVETAARYFKARDIEGIVIGDGFGPRMIDALLTVLAEDPRFRDLPVGVLGHGGLEDDRLPNVFRVEGNCERLVERLVPFVRLQAFERHLARLLKSLETDGLVDPATGLLAGAAFWRDLHRAVEQAGSSGGSLSVARFSFEDSPGARTCLDAARLFSRLVRNIDLACQEQDGSILAAFTETDLRSAHVVARRIAAVLRHTMLGCEPGERSIKPAVTLATLKPSDNVSTLVARVGTYPKVAAI